MLPLRSTAKTWISPISFGQEGNAGPPGPPARGPTSKPRPPSHAPEVLSDLARAGGREETGRPRVDITEGRFRFLVQPLAPFKDFTGRKVIEVAGERRGKAQSPALGFLRQGENPPKWENFGGVLKRINQKGQKKV